MASLIWGETQENGFSIDTCFRIPTAMTVSILWSRHPWMMAIQRGSSEVETGSKIKQPPVPLGGLAFKRTK